MDNFANFAQTTLATGIADTATALTVATDTGALFPAAPFQIIIWDLTYAHPSIAPDTHREIISVTAKSGDSFSTIVRAQEDTTARNFNEGGKTYAIANAPTAKFYLDLITVLGGLYEREPCSDPVPASGQVFDSVHVGDGANSKHDAGMGVANATDLTADSIWRLRFNLPPIIPAGQLKLKLRALANGTGAAKVNPKWVSVAIGENPSAATLNAEGTQTLTWASGDENKYMQLIVTLDADTPVGGEVLVCDLVFEDTGFTLNAISTWNAWILWE